MSLDDLLPGNNKKKAGQKKADKPVEKEVMQKLLDVDVDVVDILTKLSLFDETRDRKRRNFKNFAEDILAEYAEKNKHIIGK